MNVTIAKMQKLSRQLVGLFIVIMNWLSIAVSAITIAIGAMLFGWEQVQSSWVGKTVGTFVFLLIGGTIGVIIEGLTASNCAALRKKLVEYKAMKIAHSKIENKTQVIAAAKEEQKRSIQSSIFYLVVSIVASSSLSILGGTLFWHYVLSGMNNIIMSWIVSTGFSSAISLALIISELRKETNSELVQEALSTTAMIKEAYQADMTELMLERLARATRERLKNESQEGEIFVDAANANAYTILDGMIGNGNGTLTRLLEEKREERETYTINALQSLKQDTSSLQATDKIPVIDLGEAPKYRADKARKLMMVQKLVQKKGWQTCYDNASDIADSLGMGKSTLYRYLDELKQEVATQ